MPGVIKTSVVPLLLETWREWHEDNVMVLGTSLAYYALLSVFPLLLLMLSLVGLLLGEESSVARQWLRVIAGAEASAQAIEQIDANRQIFDLLSETLSDTAAIQIEATLQKLNESRQGAGIIGVVVLFWTSSHAFGALHRAFQIIWQKDDTPSPPRSFLSQIWLLLRRRLLAFGLVLGCALLLIILMLSNVAITVLRVYAPTLPGDRLLWQVAQPLTSFLILFLVCVLLFKYLPEVSVAWGDVWLGALLTTLLFTLLASVSSYIISRADYQAYGAIGSIMALLLWVHLSSLILFLGAEFTQVYAHMYGSHRPQPSAAALALAGVVHMRLATQVLTRSGTHQVVVGATPPRTAQAGAFVKERLKRASQHIGLALRVLVALVVGVGPLLVGILRGMRRWLSREL